jgi:hypothetical protein
LPALSVAGGGVVCSKEAVVSIALLSRVVEELCAIVSGLDADALAPCDAAEAVSVFVRGEHLCAAGKALCAARATRAGEHRRSGHGDPAAWLAERSGEPTGAARDALEVAAALGRLRGLEEALRAGELSTLKARTIAEAASMDPSSEQALLRLSREGSLSELKDGAEAIKAAARSNIDEEGRYEALRKGRHLRTFTGRDGGFKGQIALTPDDGARLLAILSPASDFFFDEARRCGRHDTHEAYLADALVAAVTGEWPGGTEGPEDDDEPEGAEGDGEGDAGGDGEGDAGGAGGSGAGSTAGTPGQVVGTPGQVAGTPGQVVGAGTSGAGPPDGPAGEQPVEGATEQAPGRNGQAGTGQGMSPAGRRRRGNPDTGPPRATVICRVDLAALKRGSLEPGERCEIPGVGPVPLSVARELFGDCFVKFVITDGIDVRSVVHYGRSIPTHLKTALQLRDRCCVVPGCGRTFGLEYDHIVEFAKGGPTTLDNLCRLCRPHHSLKTHKGYRIRGGPGHWQWVGPGRGRKEGEAGGAERAGGREGATTSTPAGDDGRRSAQNEPKRATRSTPEAVSLF